MISLVAISALANHIMLEIIAHRASLIDGFVPFLAARRTFFMGLGTLASDLLVVIIITGIMRARFANRGRRWLWRTLHATAYAAWPLAILHGLLAGRSAKPYVDWSYGACLALAALALTLRVVLQSRGRNSAEGQPDRVSTPLPPRPPTTQVFAQLPARNSGGLSAWDLAARDRTIGTPQRALPVGRTARAPRPGRPAPADWPLPEFDPDWPEWPPDGRPGGPER
jgi:hypothetical protein